MVCDACDRGFHLSCLGIRAREQHEDWVCGDCVVSGISRKWKCSLGPKVRMIDINALPPAEGDGEIGVAEEFRGANLGGYHRMNTPDEASSSGFDGQHPCPNISQIRNAFRLGNHIGTVSETMQPSSESMPHHGLNRGGASEVLVLDSSSRGKPAVDNATVSGDFKGESFLQSLRNFITERGGFLGEGWHVELRQSANRSNSYAVYCAPDGKMFESMFDVAHYLGLASAFTYMDIDERSDGSGIVQRLPPRRRKRDLTRISMTNNLIGNQDNVKISSGGELSSETEVMEPRYSDVRTPSVLRSYMEENRCHGSPNLSVGLPVQYEDFFVTCLGKIDLRISYHDNNQIWPIGYRSYWHDKITGSLFECEVSDGGDFGPVFKVRRCPCSVSSIPIGATILSHNKSNRDDTVKRTEGGSEVCDAGPDNDEDILMLISDPNPLEQDLLSCFSSEICGNSRVQMDMKKLDVSMPQLCHLEGSAEPSSKSSSLRDEIGEFYVEGRSSSSVWKMVSQTLIDACREVYKQKGYLQFCCMHDCGIFSSYSDDGTIKNLKHLGSLARFCCASGPIDTPRVIRSDKELEVSCKSLAEWLDQDRFGLDMGFVQEIIENLPSSRCCSRYQFLVDRSGSSESWTVGSGVLLPKRKKEGGGEDVVSYSYGLYGGNKRSRLQDVPKVSPLVDLRPPPGCPLSSKLPAELVGDVFQIWELLWRFYEILGLKEPVSFEELEEELIDPWPCGLDNLDKFEKENQDCRDPSSLANESANCPTSLPVGVSDSIIHGESQFLFIPIETASAREAAQAKIASHTYERCTGVALRKSHISLLKVLISELVGKVAAFVDPNFDARESKARRGRKKDMENPCPVKESKIEMLTFNELTWPELARRYVLAISCMNGSIESPEVCSRESIVFRCLQGDGGVLCGSLSGVAGMEADALLLAEAERQICGSIKRENEVFPVDYRDSEAVVACEPAATTSSSLPEWAQPLEPVRKLPTNVGTRIRKCIYDSLEKNPPEWARKILEHSISKEVYKGNASGPTKKAVLSVLAEAAGGNLLQKPDKRRKEKSPISASDAIMKKCRMVLRRAASADESKVFCNLLGTTLLNSNDNEDDGILGLPAMVSRPLDFRTIDLRLAVGAYSGSHEAFLEDVRQVWHNICSAYGDRPDLMQLVDRLSHNFESLFEKEVLYLVQKFASYAGAERLDAEKQKELHDILLSANDIPKAPWEEGVCKVCGIDKDDDSVLLCDTCDSEYHTYCLIPPLSRIPEGNWYCPSCVVSQCKTQSASPCAQIVRHQLRRYIGEESRAFQEALNQLATSMEEREYWELKMEERIFLLKFLCDEVLNSALIREHLEQCADKSNDLQQKLRTLSIDWRNLKFKEELLAMRTVKDRTFVSSGIGDVVREEGTANVCASQGGLAEQQFFSNKLINITTFSGNPLKRTPLPSESKLDENGQTDVNKNMGHLLNCMIEKHANGNKQQTRYCLTDSTVAECGIHNSDGHCINDASLHENLFSSINVRKGAEFNGQTDLLLVSSEQAHDAGEEVILGVDRGNIQSRAMHGANNSNESLEVKNILNMERNGSILSNADILRRSYLSSDNGITQLGENTLSMPMESGASMSVRELLPPNQNMLLQGTQFYTHAVVTESQAGNLELNSLKNEILHLQESLASLESQLTKTSLRREFLGRDSIGRLYWAISRPGKRPCLIVDRSMPMPQERRDLNPSMDFASKCSVLRRKSDPIISDLPNPSDCDLNCSRENSYPLVRYETDDEIQELVTWLRDTDPRDRELKECILQLRRLGFRHESNFVPNGPPSTPKTSMNERFVAPYCFTTKAAVILEQKYGPCLDQEVNEVPKKRGRKAKAGHEERMFRCECLEPIWPSRHHCLSCHQTFCTIKELEGHNDGRCAPTNPSSDESKDSDETMKGKGTKSEGTREKEHVDEVDGETSKNGKLDVSSKLIKIQRKSCPYDLDEICRKFVTNNSIKELVQEIGLIGTNGVPSFVPSSSTSLFDPSLMLNQNKKYDAYLNNGLASSDEMLSMPLQSGRVGANAPNGDSGNCAGHVTKSPRKCSGDGNNEHLRKTASEYTGGEEQVSCLNDKIQGSKASQSCTIPESSLRPLVGKISLIMKRLKINLLDMDAALPDESLRPSKSHLIRRCAWRAFVKSAESIYEMVQATVLLEGMIKADYLKNGWWYWSTLTAAAKTSTISSLALRIYTLDDSIIYVKDKDHASVDPAPAESSPRLTNKIIGKKRKDMTEVAPS